MAGLTTTISPNLTNDFRFSYLRNFWQWSTQAGPPQFAGLAAQLKSAARANWIANPVQRRFAGCPAAFLGWPRLFPVRYSSPLKGNHLFQFGGIYMRQFLFHGRDDNGVGINTSIVYQVGGTGITLALTPSRTAQPPARWRISHHVQRTYGIVNQTQVMYTRSGANLQLNPLGHAGLRPERGSDLRRIFLRYLACQARLTVTYGSVRAVHAALRNQWQAGADGGRRRQSHRHPGYMKNKQQAALTGPGLQSDDRFRDHPQYKRRREQVSLQPLLWRIQSACFFGLESELRQRHTRRRRGPNKTVIRGGYGRIYGRLNGVDLMLVPLLGPGLLQAVSCVGPTTRRSMRGSGRRDSGQRIPHWRGRQYAPLPDVTKTLPQPFFPGTFRTAYSTRPQRMGPRLDPKLNRTIPTNSTYHPAFDLLEDGCGSGLHRPQDQQ